jgi:hypothetical protein
VPVSGNQDRQEMKENRRVFRRCIGIGLLLGLIGIGCWTLLFAASRRLSGERKMNDQIVVNPRHFADLLGTSYLPYSGRLRGEIIWPSQETQQATTGGRIPTNLSIVGDVLIVSYQGFLEARDRSDGKPLWGIELINKAAFDVAVEGITTVNDAGYYLPVGLDGKIKKGERVGLPFLPGPGFLEYLQFQGDEVRYVYHSSPIPATNRGEVSIPPHFAYVRYLPKIEKLVWLFGRNEIALAVRMSVDGLWSYAATCKQLFAIPMGGSSDSDVQLRDFENIKAFSLNHQGDLLVVDSIKEGLQLKNIGSDWQQHWAVMLPAQGEIHQPPASAPNGDIYLIIDNTLCQVSNGQSTWEYDLITAKQNALLTVLADNTVLVSAGTALLQIDSRGTAILTKQLGDTLTCRAIMDERGHLYVGGRSGIHSLK